MLFDLNGFARPGIKSRVFSKTPGGYYKLEQPEVNYSEVLKNSSEFGDVDLNIGANAFQAACESLKKSIEESIDYRNILKGVHIPFITRKIKLNIDLGEDLESNDLLHYQQSFNSKFPERRFKAILQGNSELIGNISIDPRSRYDKFLEKCHSGTVIGWYFPQVLQEFDIESQREQMTCFPEFDNICLSGGLDVLAALIGSPDLLLNENFYSPILCLSSYLHKDPRLVLLLKAYGPHMEFWCMTQMLTNGVTQVSEQWSGGLTIYRSL